MIKAFAPALCLLLIACSSVNYVAYNAKTGNYEQLKMTNVGGSEAIETAGGTRFTGNRIKNTGQLIQAAASTFLSWFGVEALKSNNALAATENTNATKLASEEIAAKTAAAAEAAKLEALKAAPAGTFTPVPFPTVGF